MAQRDRQQQTIDRLTARRADTARGVGRLRSTSRDQLRRLDDQLHQAHAARRRMVDELAKVDEQLDALPIPEQLKPLDDAYDKVNGEIWQIVLQRAAAAPNDPPSYVLRSMGACPDDPQGRARWQSTLRGIESYRICWDTHDPDLPIGLPATDPLQREQRARAGQYLLEWRSYQRELVDELEVDPPQRSRSIGLSR